MKYCMYSFKTNNYVIYCINDENNNEKFFHIIKVSLTEEVCETCSSQGGVCIKSADRTCFGDKSFEPEWVKYCISDGKDHVKREERSDSDATLVSIECILIS